MDDLFLMAEAIADRLRGSILYGEYLAARQNISQDPELQRRIAQYKKMNFDYRYRLMNNEQPGFEEEKTVSSLYWALMGNAEAKKYLEGEKELLRTLRRIYDIIGDACPLDLDMDP